MPRIRLALMPLLALLVGCSVSKPATMAPEPRPLGRDLATYEAPHDPAKGVSSSSPLDEPADALTLRQALALALQGNPDLAAFSWEVRAAEARVVQARLRPNPELGVSLEEFAGSGPRAGVKAAEFALQLSQVIELGGKRMKRAQAAQFERDLSAWDYEAKRLDVLTQTAQAYVELLTAQKRLELAQSTLRL